MKEESQSRSELADALRLLRCWYSISFTEEEKAASQDHSLWPENNDGKRKPLWKLCAEAEKMLRAPVSERGFSLRHLQKHLPWTIPYSAEFEASAGENRQRRIGHDILHVMKALGRIAADVEAADHTRPRKLQGDTLAKEVADLVTCALHIARLEGFDLQDAVVKNSEARNAATIPDERKRT